MMKHTRIASYVPSPYTKNSPALRNKADTKKNSISGEVPKPGRLAQADMNVKAVNNENNHEIVEKKYSPMFLDRKNDLTASLYQLAKGIEKDKQSYSKIYKSKETQQKKVQKPASRQSDKINEKLSIYQYVQSKSKKPEDYRSVLNVSNQLSSRKSSRMIIPDEHNESLLQKVGETNGLSTKRLLGSSNDVSHSNKSKTKGTPCHQKNSASIIVKPTQKTSSTNLSKQLSIFQPSINNVSFHEVCDELTKTPDLRKFETGKISNVGSNFNDALAQKLKIALQGLQGDLQNAKHRRGLSSGQAPIFIEQHIVQPEKIKPIEIAPSDPQQEQDEFYEKFFHSEKMTFEFERLIVSQRNKAHNASSSVIATPSNNNKPATAHTRNRSIEDPNSVLPTKASSRWNTKRSSVGDELQAGGREFNLIEQISDLDKTEYEKEELRKYLRG